MQFSFGDATVRPIAFFRIGRENRPRIRSSQLPRSTIRSDSEEFSRLARPTFARTILGELRWATSAWPAGTGSPKLAGLTTKSEGWLANRSSRGVAGVSGGWRRRPDLNRGWRFCRPLPYHLATAPLGRGWGSPRTAIGRALKPGRLRHIGSARVFSETVGLPTEALETARTARLRHGYGGQAFAVSSRLTSRSG